MEYRDFSEGGGLWHAGCRSNSQPGLVPGRPGSVWSSGPVQPKQESGPCYRTKAMIHAHFHAETEISNLPRRSFPGRVNSELTHRFGKTQTAWRRERDSNPRYPCGHSGFQDRLFQPLTHPSACAHALPGLIVRRRPLLSGPRRTPSGPHHCNVVTESGASVRVSASSRSVHCTSRSSPRLVTISTRLPSGFSAAT